MPVQRSVSVASSRPYVLALHGGAGGRIVELSTERAEAFSDGLRAAYLAGEAILEAGGSALDAVCASVRSMEDNPLFNAGRGAALTYAGTAELDASVMTLGMAGAVTVSRHAKNPVDLARWVMEHTPHVLLVDPSKEIVKKAGGEVVDPRYFVTEARQQQLARILAEEEAPLTSGTVGAVAVDLQGIVAAATSTGGISKQLPGRVGDTPIIGAGTWADNRTIAISCTGDGEAFIKGVVGHDVHARLLYGGMAVETAITQSLVEALDPRAATGGLVAVTPDRVAHLAHTSAMMFAAYRDRDEIVVWV